MDLASYLATAANLLQRLARPKLHLWTRVFGTSGLVVETETFWRWSRLSRPSLNHRDQVFRSCQDRDFFFKSLICWEFSRNTFYLKAFFWKIIIFLSGPNTYKYFYYLSKKLSHLASQLGDTLQSDGWLRENHHHTHSLPPSVYRTC